jgi:hypothetical protein
MISLESKPPDGLKCYTGATLSIYDPIGNASYTVVNPYITINTILPYTIENIVNFHFTIFKFFMMIYLL